LLKKKSRRFSYAFRYTTFRSDWKRKIKKSYTTLHLQEKTILLYHFTELFSKRFIDVVGDLVKSVDRGVMFSELDDFDDRIDIELDSFFDEFFRSDIHLFVEE